MEKKPIVQIASPEPALASAPHGWQRQHTHTFETARAAQGCINARHHQIHTAATSHFNACGKSKTIAPTLQLPPARHSNKHMCKSKRMGKRSRRQIDLTSTFVFKTKITLRNHALGFPIGLSAPKGGSINRRRGHTEARTTGGCYAVKLLSEIRNIHVGAFDSQVLQSLRVLTEAQRWTAALMCLADSGSLLQRHRHAQSMHNRCIFTHGRPCHPP